LLKIIIFSDDFIKETAVFISYYFKNVRGLFYISCTHTHTSDFNPKSMIVGNILKLLENEY